MVWVDYDKGRYFDNINDLKVEVLNAWNGIVPVYHVCLQAYMGNRCVGVIKQKGHAIKY